LGVLRLAGALIAHLRRYVQNHSIYHGRLWDDFAEVLFFAAHHLEADLIDQVGVARGEELVDMVAQAIQFDVVLVVGQDAGVLLVLHGVYFEPLGEG